MPSSYVAYTPEMVQAAQTIARAAIGINDEITSLNKDHVALQALQTGANADQFAVFQDAWRKSGLDRVERFRAVAKATEDGYVSMNEFDQIQAHKWG